LTKSDREIMEILEAFDLAGAHDNVPWPTPDYISTQTLGSGKRRDRGSRNGDDRQVYEKLPGLQQETATKPLPISRSLDILVAN